MNMSTVLSVTTPKNTLTGWGSEAASWLGLQLGLQLRLRLVTTALNNTETLQLTLAPALIMTLILT